MSHLLAQRVEKKRVILEEGIKKYQEGIEKGSMDGKALQKELDLARKPSTANNWFTWRRIHTGRGLYASWKDDNFFKYLFKEIFVRRRSLPFITSGLFFSLILMNFVWVTEKNVKDSMNWFPYGYPPGSNLPHLMHELVEKDLGKAPIHQALHLQKE